MSSITNINNILTFSTSVNNENLDASNPVENKNTSIAEESFIPVSEEMEYEDVIITQNINNNGINNEESLKKALAQAEKSPINTVETNQIAQTVPTTPEEVGATLANNIQDTPVVAQTIQSTPSTPEEVGATLANETPNTTTMLTVASAVAKEISKESEEVGATLASASETPEEVGATLASATPMETLNTMKAPKQQTGSWEASFVENTEGWLAAYAAQESEFGQNTAVQGAQAVNQNAMTSPFGNFQGAAETLASIASEFANMSAMSNDMMNNTISLPTGAFGSIVAGAVASAAGATSSTAGSSASSAGSSSSSSSSSAA